jgi:protein SCO1/2
MTLARLSKVRSLLGAKNQKVMTVFVTVDPQRDTAARLKEYLGYFDNRAIGLTGTKTEIDKVVNAYKASYERIRNDSSLGYTINHTSIIYLIDGQGKVRYLFHQDDRPEKMVSIIKSISAGI